MAFDTARFAEAAGDAIVAADPQGRIVFWNAAAERIFGYSRAEALGKSLDLIIPERQRARHWAGYQKTMASGETRYGTQVLRVPALHKDGRRLSIAFTVTLLFGPDRRVQSIAALVRDETERWNEERALRDRLAQLERRQPR